MLHTRLSISRFEFRMIPKACSDEEILVKTERWIFAWITLFRLDNLFSHVNDKEINSRHSKNYSKPILSTARDWREFERLEIFCNLCLWENFTKVNSDYVFKNINIVNNSERTILGVVCRSLNLKIVKYSSACMKSLSIDLTYAENDFIKMYGCTCYAI